MDLFAGHGSVDLQIRDRILYVEGSGPWNIESVKKAGETFNPLISQLSGKPWAVLVVLHGDPIYVPAAAEYLIEAIKRERELGRVATAIMVDKANTPSFAKRHLSEIYKKAGCEFEFFSQQEEATWWLVKQISLADGRL
ncbi:hypothetical protein RS130_21100 [Paraglaciecola aquimarina]|uniref:STAS/SEC14 domain-containing protein n=1 Tax=Paraglaciecola aquimarina TaxID=1235557 RepID=A0ABU3T1A5_9ALTE|nr:hypothetical protein [Paraglaciecola aquimarina]MDU0356056.1 hypothetical protein [Paraglaciecola aquimarina]